MAPFQELIGFLPIVIAVTHVVGILTAIDALSLVRSSQGAIAWGLFVIVFPYLGVPLYWIFGRSRFKGYRELMHSFTANSAGVVESYKALVDHYILPRDRERSSLVETLERTSDHLFVSGNSTQLLIDGQATFASIFDSISKAKRYILIQFYIFRDDSLGQELKRHLIARAQAGVHVSFLYDEVGSDSLSEGYLAELRQAGITVAAFDTRRGRGNFFQLNFRNHRKVVVVDGITGFVGGLNVGKEYLGEDRDYGPWRDTHLKIDGPAVLQIQRAFFSDWLWATDTPPRLDWATPLVAGNKAVLTVPSGPSDEKARCLLTFLEMINAATKRLWIATPYFVPDDSILTALQLAALRGVDVRLLLPQKPDHIPLWLAALFFIPEVCRYHVRVFSYTKGFMHQKAILVDDEVAAIGTVNLDNRSLILNFEITMIVADKEFNSQVAKMLEADFADSVEQNFTELSSLPGWQQLGARVARLFAPIL